MAKLADLIEKNQELLASIDAWDNGKAQPQADCSRGLSMLTDHRQALHSSIS